MNLFRLLQILFLSIVPSSGLSAELPLVAFEKGEGNLVITVSGKPFATYAYQNEKIQRPDFTNVYSPAGIKVTRNFPVQADDFKDHPHHTGTFISFGSLNGIDFWHLHGKVEHVRFLQEPKGDEGIGTFVAENRYLSNDGKTFYCKEVSRCEIRTSSHGYWLSVDNTLTAGERELVFGSKEEGGMTVRVATPLTVKKGGQMTDSEGRSGENEIWGKQADWVDYSGMIDGKYVGVMIIPNSENFSRCWWHARDYGLLAANPFGPLNARATTKVVKPGESIRLRYTLLFHSEDAAEDFDSQAAFEQRVRHAASK